MTELFTLGLLMRQTRHGQAVTQILDTALGPFDGVSPEQTDALLAEFETRGLVEAIDGSHDRATARYRITQAGRERFHALMLDTEAYLPTYRDIFTCKVPHLPFLEPHERAHLLEHYLAYCKAQQAHLDEHIQHLRHARDEEGAGLIDPIFDVLTHRRRCWEQEQDWVRCLREREPVTLVATGVV